MAKKVIIFGSKGTLGRSLAGVFLNSGYNVVGLDRDEADVTDPEIGQVVVSHKPDIVINATGYNAVDLAETDLEERKKCFTLNAEAPKFLAEAAKDAKAIFVHYSSDLIFDGKKESGGYIETDEPNPLSEYGKSKVLGEKNVAEVGGQFFIIRPSRIYGKRDSQTAKKSFVDIMLDKAGLPEVKVVADEYGSPTYAPDLAEFTKKLVEGEHFPGIYHGVNSGTCSKYEWAEEIFRIVGRGPDKLLKITSAEYNNPAPRPLNSTLLNTKTEPLRPWQKALEEFLSGE